MNKRTRNPRRDTALVEGNVFDKYGTRNIIYEYLMKKFIAAASDMVRSINPQNVLEVGCGSGELADKLFGVLAAEAEKKPDYVGTDISGNQIKEAARRFPDRKFQVASVYKLPFANSSFDLVIACEVLEHLTEPEDALQEMRRVCCGYILCSVPWEPVWRILNIFRGKYWRDGGNTPGHVQHFTRSQFIKLISQKFAIVRKRNPFPWSMLLAKLPESCD